MQNSPQDTTDTSTPGHGDGSFQPDPQDRGLTTGERPRSSANRAFIGIDNGFTGALACLLPNGSVFCRPVAVIDLGKERLLDFDANRLILREMIQASGVSPQEVLAVYEQCQPNRIFGARNNFTNGKNGEFWRLLLTFEGIPFRWVNPQQWQRWIFRGIRGKDTKAMAHLVRRQRFPSVSLEAFNTTEVEGINDAVCIALWASELSAWSVQTTAAASSFCKPDHEALNLAPLRRG
jgi:hypothetical protein